MHHSGCYEVRCDNTWISDNYGQSLDRTYSCYNDTASVVLRITGKSPVHMTGTACAAMPRAAPAFAELQGMPSQASRSATGCACRSCCWLHGTLNSASS